MDQVLPTKEAAADPTPLPRTCLIQHPPYTHLSHHKSDYASENLVSLVSCGTWSGKDLGGVLDRGGSRRCCISHAERCHDDPVKHHQLKAASENNRQEATCSPLWRNSHQLDCRTVAYSSLHVPCPRMAAAVPSVPGPCKGIRGCVWRASR